MKRKFFHPALKSLLIAACIFSSAHLWAEDQHDWEEIIEKEIENIKQEQKTLLRRMPHRKHWRRLYCYFHCVKAVGPSCCRVQMAGLRKKEIPTGVYYAPCPRKCNYPKRGNPLDGRHKPISGCTHYDDNGYWFVTLVCNAHKAHWHYDSVAKYRRMERQYHSFEMDWRAYVGLQKKLKQKQKQLDKLLDN